MQPQMAIGVDEVGRGPLAGPVVVGAACVPRDFDWNTFPGVNDSKKLSEKKRETIFTAAIEARKGGALTFATAKVSAPVIDRLGITRAVSLGVVRSLSRISYAPHEVFVKLDGLLKAPQKYMNQETIIKGDEREKEIALASIIAKVTRDRYMTKMASRYSQYGFEQHKGYGTENHRSAIKLYGISGFHRGTFCRAFTQEKAPR